MNFPVSAGTAINLQSELSSLPDSWAYVAANGRKAPLGDGWQNHPLTKKELFTALNNDLLPSKLQWKGNAIASNRIKAIGAFCGEKSGGLVFVDHDGESCDQLIEKLSGESLEQALPDAPMVTSGKHGRYQLVYRIPGKYWGAIATKKIKTGVDGPSGKPEMLELRWNGCQSIVAGLHPETGAYTWVTPPVGEIPEAPNWLIEQMIVEHRPSTKAVHPDSEWAMDYLKSIPPTEDYDEWVKVGQALHSVSDSLMWIWDEWSTGANNYTPGECEKKWKTFHFSPGKGLSIGYLGMLAKQNGWERPSFADCPSRSSDRPETTYKLTDLSPEDKYTKFRQEVTLALAIEDLNKRDFVLEEIAAKYRRSKRFMAQLLADLEERRKPEKRKTKFTLTEMLERETEGVSYLIEDLLPKGEVAILTARPKVGKSLLAYEAAYAVATGGKFAKHFRAKQGKVLFLQTEEGDNEIQKRLITRGFGDVPPENMEIWTKWHWRGGMAELEEKLAEFKPSLVVVDSLRKVMSTSGISENSAEFAAPVYQIADSVREYGASCIIIHHDNKQKDKDGNDLGGQDGMSGTSALGGSVSGIWSLSKISRNPENTERHLNLTLRSGPGGRHSISLKEGEGRTWEWEWNQEINVDPEVGQLEKKILYVLNSSSQEEMTLREICGALGIDPSNRSLYRPANRLIERGRVIIRRGSNKTIWYSLPDGVREKKSKIESDICSTYTEQGLQVEHPYDQPVQPVQDVQLGSNKKGDTYKADQPNMYPVNTESIAYVDQPVEQVDQPSVQPVNQAPSTLNTISPISEKNISRDHPPILVQKNGVVEYQKKAIPQHPPRNGNTLLCRPARAGDIVRYATSFSDWLVVSVDGDRATIRADMGSYGVQERTVQLTEISPTGRFQS